MTSNSPASASLVVDASAAVWAVVPGKAPIDTLAMFERWSEQRASLCAPVLWLVECTSAIRRYEYAKVLTTHEAEVALEDLLALRVEMIPMSHDHSRAALRWARVLGQARAYDSVYLAVAEERGVPLWTADRRLANAARQAHIPWVHWIGGGLD